MSKHGTIGALLALALTVQGCSGGSSGGATPTPTVAATTAPSPSPTSAALNLSALPLDDGYVSTSPKVGYVDSCTTSFDGAGASTDGPWIDTAANTFDLTT